MSVVVRLARIDEAESLPAVERSAGEAFRAIPDLAWIADDDVLSADAHSAAIAAGTAWIAADGDVAVGFLTAEPAGDALHILELAVRFDRQRRGLGRRLIDAAADHARALGLTVLTLTTFRDVPWNGPYYARLGFTIIDERNLNPRLAAIVTEEEARGMPQGSRCAMRWALGR